MFDRTSAKSAEQVFGQLFPDAETRHICVNFMAASMALAHSCAPDRWGVTLFTDAVRLNVGMIEVLTFAANQLHVVVDSDVISLDLSQSLGIARSRAPYVSVPTSAGCDFPAHAAAANLPLLQTSHEALVRKAAATRIHPAIRNAYSAGVATFLSQGRPSALAHPRYHVEERGRAKQNLPEGNDHRLFVQAGEIATVSPLIEGASLPISVNRYERNQEARRQAIEHYGCHCAVCGFDFEKIYGQLGHGFIHVHHLKPLSEIGKDYAVDPIRDLRPICANCHAVIHRGLNMLSIEELKDIIREALSGEGYTSGAPGNILPSQITP